MIQSRIFFFLLNNNHLEGSKILQTRQILGNFYQDCLNAIAAIQDNFVNGELS